MNGSGGGGGGKNLFKRMAVFILEDTLSNWTNYLLLHIIQDEWCVLCPSLY